MLHPCTELYLLFLRLILSGFSMENQRPVVCPENEDLAAFMWKKRQEMVEANAISHRIDATLSRAYASVCSSKNHIKTMKDFSQVKSVGHWILRLMQQFFQSDSTTSPSKEHTGKGKKTKGSKRYIPQRNSVAYALLITLYRGISNGNVFMRKQELIDAADASGLSRVPIAPEKGKGKLTQFGSSPREWYSGWSCMKTLIMKGLIVKSSCPAKYMLTQEGQDVARECLLRSGLIDSSENLTARDEDELDCQASHDALNLIHHTILDHQDATGISAVSVKQKKSDNISTGILEEHAPLGRIWEQTSMEAPESTNSEKSIPSVGCAISGHPQKDHIYILDSDSEEIPDKQYPVLLNQCISIDIDAEENGIMNTASDGTKHGLDCSISIDSPPAPLTLRACSSSHAKDLECNVNSLAMPPRRTGEKFEDIYDVILILDDREQFVKTKCRFRSRKVVESISAQFKIQVEIRRLPVGDGIWIARHKSLHTEYVLDFIVERKEVDDLHGSIRDNRYKDQKLRLLRCGLQKLIYLVEGNPNLCDAAEGIKTACFTTEILEGFDVQRTSGLTETLKKYGHLTHSISDYYQMQFSKEANKSSRICPSFYDFIKKCQDLDKMTVSDVFAVQLMQVPQVTEEVVHAVLELYPTVLSLARAYSRLDGNLRAQEEMLKNQTSVIGAAASKNIFKLVWGC
ncbi:crossover junction endonuclease MUS81 isoform X2 [Aristolochia californica]|uniref:crossover junction endonuclease MUS81 isoform X2 n=1 Tax=Aristolochia californica TaxID=171875 RepID=UPI0035D72671